MIYFLQDENDDRAPVKIGWTTNLDDRLKTLATGSPVKLKLIRCVEAASHMEGRFHKMFQDVRLRGEWFRWTPDILTAFPRGYAVDIETGQSKQIGPDVETWAGLLTVLFEHPAVITDYQRQAFPDFPNMTIGHLVASVLANQAGLYLRDRLLASCGIKIRQEHLLVSTNHPVLFTIFASTPLGAGGWSKILRHALGARVPQTNVRFGTNHAGKATWIPTDTLKHIDALPDLEY